MDTEFLRTLDRQILLGVFVAFVAVSASAAYCLSSSKKRRGCLDPENFKEFKLVKKQQLSHNVAKLVFELPSSTAVLGLPIGQHISCRFCSSMSSSLVYLCFVLVSQRATVPCWRSLWASLCSLMWTIYSSSFLYVKFGLKVLSYSDP
ncbi:NADH--cytochrome b5 reductase 1 isoform X1 [Raphanus sativus]|uniref:NADH--cytochrome b5 reductase 1 isoform X1 n=1 Tax=Raphanus sativus TaxID=3726 RepID=A0A6J0M9Q8_RAPSA|nr:NADH--cytochrome b5 reductase 1 isoform X1 [Raphanus sativus]